MPASKPQTSSTPKVVREIRQLRISTAHLSADNNKCCRCRCRW